MSEKKHIVIIGSGLGGLSCGAVLAKNGHRVTVLEQGAQVGGCLQCFTRKGAKFETGMHFVGSAAEGQTLHRLMRYLEIDRSVRLAPLDTSAYDIVSIGGQRYPFANGREAFVEGLAAFFPGQRGNLERYCDMVERVAAASSVHTLDCAKADEAVNTEFQLRAVDEVIDEVITDPLLAKVLAGNLPLYAAEKGKTPFSTHAFIMDFYNQSAFRIAGGSDTVASALADTVRRYGGEVRTRCRAAAIKCDDTHATAVLTATGESIGCDWVVSAIHPMRTLELLSTSLIRPAFRRRVNGIPQTVGVFSVYLHFKPGTVPYLNSNYYGYEGDTPWGCEHYTDDEWPKGFLYMHFCQEPGQRHASTGMLLSYMQMSDVEQWKGTRTGRRGAAYEDFKRRKAERLLDVLERHFPGTRAAIGCYYTSTPLTYLDYTGTEGGSMYGNARDIHLGAACRVPHRTRVPNLLLAGQNINSHGMLGVLVGTVVACGELIGTREIYRQIKEASK